MKKRIETLLEIFFLMLLFFMALYIFTEKGAEEKMYIGILLLINLLVLAYYIGKWLLIEFRFLEYHINEHGKRKAVWDFKKY